jgi:osmoprotectant transport system ATP-binding protein
VRRARAREAARALLDRVGLPESVADRFPAQLSGGPQQRVGVARALAADPPILLMDEPFSAVDPVVRAQLQDEMVRIQRELGTTVVFVTHDFDEALRLGDLIVVFAPGGRIAQVAEPATLLAAPADDFVADFIGHDRGYRALSFADAGALPTRAVATVSAEETLAAAGAGDDRASVGDRPGSVRDAAAGGPADRWALLLDRDRRPQGWLDRAGMQAGRAPTRHDLRLGGTLIRPGGSLRSALDAALSSPSGSGVAVDDDGRLIGIVAAQDILAAIERARRNATARDALSPVVGYADDGTAGGAATVPSGAP